MRERLFVQLSPVVMRIISKSFEVSARKITQREDCLLSDSTTVLHWIHQTSSNYKAFVGNRELHTIMSDLDATLGAGKVCWRYVPTESNPADDITRALHPDHST